MSELQHNMLPVMESHSRQHKVTKALVVKRHEQVEAVTLFLEVQPQISMSDPILTNLSTLI